MYLAWHWDPILLGDGDGLALYVKQTRERAHPFLMKLSIQNVFLIAKKCNLPCFEEILIGGRVRVSGMALGPNTIGRW